MLRKEASAEGKGESKVKIGSFQAVSRRSSGVSTRNGAQEVEIRQQNLKEGIKEKISTRHASVSSEMRTLKDLLMFSYFRYNFYLLWFYFKKKTYLLSIRLINRDF